jgi:hypothetical protein
MWEIFKDLARNNSEKPPFKTKLNQLYACTSSLGCEGESAGKFTSRYGVTLKKTVLPASVIESYSATSVK